MKFKNFKKSVEELTFVIDFFTIEDAYNFLSKIINLNFDYGIKYLVKDLKIIFKLDNDHFFWRLDDVIETAKKELDENEMKMKKLSKLQMEKFKKKFLNDIKDEIYKLESNCYFGHNFQLPLKNEFCGFFESKTIKKQLYCFDRIEIIIKSDWIWNDAYHNIVGFYLELKKELENEN